MNMIIGRKEIMARLNILNWNTIRKWKRDYKMPMRYMPNKKPLVIISELEDWIIKYSELKKSKPA